MVLLNAAISYGIVRLNAPVTAAFNMKQTVDAFLTAPVRNNCQKHSQKPFQRVLTRHWKPACRHGSRNTTRSFWCPPAVVQGAPDITRESSRILPGE
ncbi:TrbI F-type domain-containing protein [Escherichia coli]|uniref:TrbI F-type domain-containing protein n=1 Tax=Escherichia coli TaxID=562 RepID=UPI003D7F99EB